MSIEALCKTYPDVPVNILIKTEALRLGVGFSQAARDVTRTLDTQFKGYFIFSQDQGIPTKHEEKIPDTIFLKNDDTPWQTRVNQNSPYYIDFKDGKFMFYDETAPVAEVYFEPAPGWLHYVFEDGMPMQAVIRQVGKDATNAHIDYFCEFWLTNEQCLFCDIGAHLRSKKQESNPAPRRHSPERIARAHAMALKEPGYRHFNVSSGSILRERDGKSETEWFCDYFYAIKEALHGIKWPSKFQIVAKPKNEIKMLYDTGLTSLGMNMEVWDERLFNTIGPGKARTIGWKEWIKRLFEAVDIFGKGGILSNFVNGVEMSQPWGFKDPREAVKSNLSGFDYLMSHGVLPRTSVWTVEPNSRLGGQRPAPLEYYIELERGYLELREKYGFPFPLQTYCHGCTVINCSEDWDYYLGKDLPNPRLSRK
ncbi:MAG: hypothetical protein HY673_12080 [Chloroflexi bacterium]|nr:hypothetical protein [Chloroflexota bacterium]